MATISPHTTRATGTILTAVIYNGDHANHILNATNLNNAKIEGPGPVVDNAFALFDGTSGFMLKSGGLTLSNSQLADMAAATVKGRALGAGTGDPTDLTASQLISILSGGLTDTFSVSGNRWAALTLIGSDGVMEVGRILDFHDSDGDTNDFSIRLRSDDIAGQLTISSSVVGTARKMFHDQDFTAPACGMVLLASGTVSSAATLDLVLTSYTGFRALKFVLQLIPATDGVALYSRFSTNGGSSYDAGASDYNYAGFWIGDATGGGTTSGGIQSGAAAQIQLSSPQAGYMIGNGSAEGIHTEVTLMGQTNAALWSRLIYQGYHISNNATPLGTHQSGGGARETAQDTDAIRFLFSSGNIASGNYAVYGLA